MYPAGGDTIPGRRRPLPRAAARAARVDSGAPAGLCFPVHGKVNVKATKNRRAGDPAPPTPLVIERVSPELDCGRYAVKRLVNDVVRVRAAIFKDGHDLLAARVRYRGPSDAAPRYAPLAYDQPTDFWHGEFTVDQIGEWHFTVEGWTDRFGTWQRDLEKKLGAGQDVRLELLEGAELLDATARRTRFGDARTALARA